MITCFLKILKILRKHYSEKEIIFNKNFQSLLGGPNWIENRNNKKVVCIRKYIGIKNLGDLTLIITLPIKILDAHSIPHSHGPKFWTNYNYKFASIRASTGTINSACHSINAIASEYIQNIIQFKQYRNRGIKNKFSSIKIKRYGIL